MTASCCYTTSELGHLVSFASRDQDFSRRCPHLTDKLKVKEVRVPPRVTDTGDGGTWVAFTVKGTASSL